MKFEDFKKKYRKEIDYRLVVCLLNALTIELQNILGEKRFLKKIEATVKRINTCLNEDLRLICEEFKENDPQNVLSKIEDIGLFFESPDLRGLHRTKQIPSSKVLLKEYDELHGELRCRIKRGYRNPIAKEKDLNSVLSKTFNREAPNLTKFIKQWSKLRLSEIAWNALAFKYGVSASKIKKALNRRKICEKLESVNQ